MAGVFAALREDEKARRREAKEESKEVEAAADDTNSSAHLATVTSSTTTTQKESPDRSKLFFSATGGRLWADVSEDEEEEEDDSCSRSSNEFPSKRFPSDDPRGFRHSAKFSAPVRGVRVAPLVGGGENIVGAILGGVGRVNMNTSADQLNVISFHHSGGLSEDDETSSSSSSSSEEEVFAEMSAQPNDQLPDKPMLDGGKSLTRKERQQLQSKEIDDMQRMLEECGLSTKDLDENNLSATGASKKRKRKNAPKKSPEGSGPGEEGIAETPPVPVAPLVDVSTARAKLEAARTKPATTQKKSSRAAQAALAVAKKKGEGKKKGKKVPQYER